ncbi:MAG: hypothetical protein WCS72_13040 [Deltaproteobacteria bacterium]
MKKALIAGGVILGVGAGAIGVILLVDGSTSFESFLPAGSSSIPSNTPPPAPLTPLPPLKPLPDAPNQAGPGPQVVFEPAPPKPEKGTWAAVPAATRAAGLGAAGAVVSEFLAEAQEQITECFDEEVQSRHGQIPVSRSPTDRSEDADGPTLLVLHLETRPGEIRIADAPVEVQGGASDGLVACAQRVLRGQVISTPGSTKVGRARLVFPLVP